MKFGAPHLLSIASGLCLGAECPFCSLPVIKRFSLITNIGILVPSYAYALYTIDTYTIDSINKNGKRTREEHKLKPKNAMTNDTKDNAETRNTKRLKKTNDKPKTKIDRTGIG